MTDSATSEMPATKVEEDTKLEPGEASETSPPHATTNQSTATNEPARKPPTPPPASQQQAPPQLAVQMTQAGPGKLSQPIVQLTVEQQLQKSRRDLESMVLKYAKSEQENLKNQQRVEELDKRLKRTQKDNEQLANRIKLLTNDKSQLTDTLNAKLAQLTVLEQKNSTLASEQATLLRNQEAQIKQLKEENEELLRQLEGRRDKETELLDISERLSMRHMLLQSELEETLGKVPEFQEQCEAAQREREQLVRQREEMSEQVERLTEQLERERQRNESLRQERELEAANFQRRSDEFDNELKMLKRKHQVAMKVLTKELKAKLLAPSSESAHLQVQ